MPECVKCGKEFDYIARRLGRRKEICPDCKKGNLSGGQFYKKKINVIEKENKFLKTQLKTLREKREK